MKPGILWLYVAIAENEYNAKECTIKECRAKEGSYFGICQFELDNRFDNLKLVDLTIPLMYTLDTRIGIPVPELHFILILILQERI